MFEAHSNKNFRSLSPDVCDILGWLPAGLHCKPHSCQYPVLWKDDWHHSSRGSFCWNDLETLPCGGLHLDELKTDLVLCADRQAACVWGDQPCHWNWQSKIMHERRQLISWMNSKFQCTLILAAADLESSLLNPVLTSSETGRWVS